MYLEQLLLLPNNYYGVIYKTEIGSVFNQILSFEAYKMYITAIFRHLVLKLDKNKNLRYLNKATADTAEKDKLYL